MIDRRSPWLIWFAGRKNSVFLVYHPFWFDHFDRLLISFSFLSISILYTSLLARPIPELPREEKEEAENWDKSSVCFFLGGKQGEGSWGGGNTQVCRVGDITAIQGGSRPRVHVRAVRRKGCVAESSPSPHGGRGALPSEGGSPSDLLFLAGGGAVVSFSLASPVLAVLARVGWRFWVIGFCVESVCDREEVTKMLSIERVPTVVSNFQNEEEGKGGCGRNCLGKCCLLLGIAYFLASRGWLIRLMIDHFGPPLSMLIFVIYKSTLNISISNMQFW